MQYIAQITRIIEHLTDNLTFKIEKLIKIEVAKKSFKLNTLLSSV